MAAASPPQEEPTQCSAPPPLPPPAHPPPPGYTAATSAAAIADAEAAEARAQEDQQQEDQQQEDQQQFRGDYGVGEGEGWDTPPSGILVLDEVTEARRSRAETLTKQRLAQKGQEIEDIARLRETLACGVCGVEGTVKECHSCTLRVCQQCTCKEPHSCAWCEDCCDRWSSSEKTYSIRLHWAPSLLASASAGGSRQRAAPRGAQGRARWLSASRHSCRGRSLPRGGRRQALGRGAPAPPRRTRRRDRGGAALDRRRLGH